MALPAFNMRQLLEAGVHFGHQKHRWNPKMAPFIFGTRNNIHIIDLAQTVPMLHQALVTISDAVARGGRVLFVGTKRQASDALAEAAKRSAQYYVNHRWLGGTLTNWKTISNSIRRLRNLEEVIAGEGQGLTKKELLGLTNERNKLERSLGGIKDMGGVPDILFVIDTNKESIAVAEARKLGLPVIAVVDTNCDPDGISFPIPGNDDAGRAISLYCDLVAKAAIDGIERGQGSAGIDVGEAESPALEELDDEAVATGARVEQQARPGKKAERRGRKGADARQAPAAKTADAKKATDTQPAPDAAASAAAGESGFKPLKKPEGEPDDLKKINGIGPVLEQKLNAYGIFHYRQIADLKKAEAAEIDSAVDFKGRTEWGDWIKQAKTLAKDKAKESA